MLNAQLMHHDRRQPNSSVMSAITLNNLGSVFYWLIFMWMWNLLLGLQEEGAQHLPPSIIQAPLHPVCSVALHLAPRLLWLYGINGTCYVQYGSEDDPYRCPVWAAFIHRHRGQYQWWWLRPWCQTIQQTVINAAISIATRPRSDVTAVNPTGTMESGLSMGEARRRMYALWPY